MITEQTLSSISHQTSLLIEVLLHPQILTPLHLDILTHPQSSHFNSLLFLTIFFLNSPPLNPNNSQTSPHPTQIALPTLDAIIVFTEHISPHQKLRSMKVPFFYQFFFFFTALYPSIQNSIWNFDLKNQMKDFPSGPVVITLCFHRGMQGHGV